MTIFNVKESPYSALGDGVANDQPAIQCAILAAGAAGGGTVYLPQGTYRIHAGLCVEQDGVILAGDGPASLLRHPEMSSPFIPVLFQKGSASGADPGELRNVGARDFAIEFVREGPPSAPAIQFNRCVDWSCERLTVRGDRAGMGSSTTNGIAAGFGSRRGVISGCLVDGVSKPAFYVSWGEDISVVGCTAQHIKSVALPGSGVGFATGEARRVSFVDCHAAHCEGNGFQITNLGTYRFLVLSADATGTQLTIESAPVGKPFGALAPMIMDAIGIFDPARTRYVALAVQAVARSGSSTSQWHVTLAERAPVPLVAGSTFVEAGFRPYDGVRILGGSSCDNGAVGILGAGVGVGSLVVGAVGRDLLISGLTCTGNAFGPGIYAGSVEDLTITGCILRNNQSGILIEDVAPLTAAADLTGPVRITGCEIRDNRRYGVMLHGPRDVTVERTSVSVTGAPLAQTGIHFWSMSGGAAPRRPRNIHLHELELGSLALPRALYHENQELGPTYGSEHAAETGAYVIAHAGAPEGVIYAPPGSDYTDTATGAKYRKETAGTLRTGWVQLPPSAPAPAL